MRAAQQKCQAATSERGFVLLSVVLSITLIALVAFTIGNQTSVQVNAAAGELQRDELRYVAEAGFAHAQWQLTQNTTCSGYANLASTNFSTSSYSASVSPGSGSPISVSSVGTLANGTSMSLSRDNVKVYEASSTIVLQPGPEGEDAEIWDQSPNNNYGDGAETWVSSAANDTTRSFLRFNMDAIPPNATVLDATLSLRRWSGSGANQPVSAHLIRNQWGEAAVTWNSRESGTSWDTAGGDFENSPIVTTPVGPTNVRYEWSIAPLVQGWVGGSYANYGVALVAGIAGMSGHRFYTGDATSIDRRPSLSVTYACECGQSCGAVPPNGVNLLLVADDASNPNSLVLAHKNLIESWGYAVTLGTAAEPQSVYETYPGNFDVVYVPSSIDYLDVSNKLKLLPIGVVNEVFTLTSYLGFTSGSSSLTGSQADIVDNAHEITSPFGLGNLTITSSSQTLRRFVNSMGPGVHTLATRPGTIDPMMMTLNTGDELLWGGQAPDRRVMLPWGNLTFDINTLSVDGQTIMQRAIDWTANVGVVFGPIAHWKLDETSGTTAVDSVGGHDGVMSSGSWTPSGIIDGALNFPGNANVRVPHDPTLILNQQFTLSAWATASPDIGYHTIINKGTSSNSQDYWFGVWGNWLTLGFYTNGGFNYVEVQMPDWIPSQATHFAASFNNATDEVRLYKNGVLLHTGSMIYEPVAGDEDLIIGRSQLSEYWNGMLDDVRIYDRALTDTEVAELAALGFGPIAHWKLDETSGTTAVDSVDGHNGTLVNMDPSTDWVTGMVSGGLDFDGTNDYIDVSSMNPMSYDDFTVSAWYKSTDNGVSDDEYIFEHNDNFSYEVTFGPTDDGTVDRLRFGFSNGGPSYSTWDPHYGTSNIADQQWHHVVGIREAGRIKLYVDSIQESDGPDAHAGSTITIDGDGPFIGDLPGNTERVHGTLDDVRLYDYALSDSEIADLFTVGSGGGGGGGGGGSPDNFGFDTIFSSSQSNVRRKQIATQVTLPVDGTVTSITAYVGDKEDDVRYAIYTDIAGEPGALLAESDNEDSPDPIDWFTIDIPETALTAGTYWLALSFNSRDQIYRYESGGQTRYNNNRATNNGFSANWGSSSASHTRNISIYATYTP